MTSLFRGLLCGLLVAAAVPAMGVIYADQTQLDLFRHYDRATGEQLVTVDSARTGVVINGGSVNAQVDGASARWDMLFSLNDVYTASRLVLDYTGYHPDSFSIYYSTTGTADGDFIPLVENMTAQMTTHQDKWVFDLPGGADGTAIKHLKIVQDPSTVDNHIRMSNVQLFAAANNTFDDEKDGFNYMANEDNRPTYSYAPGMGFGNGVTFMCEAPNHVFDNDPVSGYVRPSNTDVSPNWYVVPLGELKALWGINMGFFDNWGSCYIDVSAAADMPIANPLTEGYDADAWTNIHANPNNQYTEFLWFGEEGVEAQWVRVRFAGGNGLTEMELYVAAIPEPATMTLLAMGGLAMLRRRK